MYQNTALEINEQNLQQVIEQSMPETLEVNAMLEKLAREYQGQFILASLNCETQQMVASQFGVRGLPTVALFKDGQPADGSAGPQTEQTLREMLTRHLPSQEEIALKQALVLVDNKEYAQALPLLRQLSTQLPNDSLVKLAIAECLIETALFDEAEPILATIPMQDQDAQYKGLVAKLELHKQAGNSPEIQQLEQKLAADPDNVELRYELAVQYSQVNRNEEALELLITILRKDMNFSDGNAKKTMMDILVALGQGNPIAASYRRQLYSLMY